MVSCGKYLFPQQDNKIFTVFKLINQGEKWIFSLFFALAWGREEGSSRL